MKGLELCRKYYETYGAPLLHEQFAEWENDIAVGLCGAGSECFGYDDAVSQDHDFEPAFCLFLPGEDVIDRQTAFRLERAYAKLPREFEGFARAPLSPVGGARHGVIRMAEWFSEKVGSPDGVLSTAQWFSLPSHFLAEATNGAVFADKRGEFSAIRARLSVYPEDVRRKKLAGHLTLAAQAGQYNYGRCLAHGERGAAQLAIGEFARHAMAAAFLIENRYMPYYKWQFRALRELPRLAGLADILEFLLTSENDEKTAATKAELMEDAAAMLIEPLSDDGLSRAVCGDLAKHAASVEDGVRDPEIRNLHILAGVE